MLLFYYTEGKINLGVLHTRNGALVYCSFTCGNIGTCMSSPMSCMYACTTLLMHQDAGHRESH